MKFKCEKNTFLEKRLNAKKLKEKTFTYFKDGKVILMTNYEILQIFLDKANKKQLKNIESIFTSQNFSDQSINTFANSFAQEFLL